jgi:NDP-sugar pyrophosphorylase family protein
VRAVLPAAGLGTRFFPITTPGPLADFLQQPFVLLYGDGVTDASLARLLERHRASGSIATIADYESDQLGEKSLLSLSGDGRERDVAEGRLAW